jgi:serine phosphatase RsbU (regulator of sigma subunit)/uncharacterized protein YigA (DUF484 family)
MVVEAQRHRLGALAEAAARLAATDDLRAAVAVISAGAAASLDAEVVVVRLLDEEGHLAARSVAPEGSWLGAEAAATRADVDRLGDGLPSESVERIADRLGTAALAAPAVAGGRVVGSVEAVLRREPAAEDEALLLLAAAQVALAVRTLAPGTHSASDFRRAAWLELAGEALAAGGEPARVMRHAVTIAADATGARSGLVWRVEHDGTLIRLASTGAADAVLARAEELARTSLDPWRPVAAAADPALPGATPNVVTLPLGQPAFAVLQLFYAPDAAPAEADLPALASFASRAAHALRSGRHAQAVEQELERTRALLEIVSEAISRLSLAHTLETAVERISELLQVDQVGVYLREEGALFAAAGRGISGRHDVVAQALSQAFLGPLRARASVHAHVRDHDTPLSPVRRALRRAGQRSVAAVPLHVREESIGLLVAYPGDRELTESELALLVALAAQLAVAVQNARLHERATELGSALYEVLGAEREASRQVNALYEISRSFAQTLSLDSTLQAVTETLVREFGVDAAVIRVPDERGDQLVPRAVHVADSRLAEALRTLLERPQPRPRRSNEPVLLDERTLALLGGAHSVLGPFLEAGSTAALLPIATTTDLLAELTIVSLDPASPITDETLASARTIAQQAALAIDNARLYQQQKAFAETMQQSLLPRERPTVPGLDVGRVYESAAQVDVGGDVYDFLELSDGRLAVVLGDVTGHGIDATADMAMAKFVFRSLAREHPEPGEFLRYVNDVVEDEIAPGKFITMAYVTVESSGRVLCASAGHPEPRVVAPDGRVQALECRGLALGVLAPQEYDQVAVDLPPGGSVVLYTDGVIESRRGGELFGVERLDDVLSSSATLSAQQIAEAVLAASRGFAGGGLPDDCAVVVIKRAP